MNKKTLSLFLLAGLFVSCGVSAQEWNRSSMPERRNFRPAPARLSAENAKKWAQIQSTLKKKYPEAVFKIAKGYGHGGFQAEDPEKYAAMMAELISGSEMR